MINSMKSDDEIIKDVSSRIKMRRIALHLTQDELATKSNLSLKTIVALENGKPFSFKSLLQVLRVLKWLEQLDLAFPEQVTDPYEIFARGHKAQRVRPKTNDKTNWKWGDE